MTPGEVLIAPKIAAPSTMARGWRPVGVNEIIHYRDIVVAIIARPTNSTSPKIAPTAFVMVAEVYDTRNDTSLMLLFSAVNSVARRIECRSGTRHVRSDPNSVKRLCTRPIEQLLIPLANHRAAIPSHDCLHGPVKESNRDPHRIEDS